MNIFKIKLHCIYEYVTNITFVFPTTERFTAVGENLSYRVPVIETVNNGG